MSSCEETTLDRILQPSTTTAAAVSSHEDSIPRMRVGMALSLPVEILMLAQPGESSAQLAKLIVGFFRLRELCALPRFEAPAFGTQGSSPLPRSATAFHPCRAPNLGI